MLPSLVYFLAKTNKLPLSQDTQTLKYLVSVLIGACYLLQEIALEVDEVVGLHDSGTTLTAEHSGEQRLHGWWALPCAHHSIGDLQLLCAQNSFSV